MRPELSHEELQELLGVYSLDAVPMDERVEVEAHLAGCPRCRAEVAEHLEIAALLAGGGAPAPDGVWDRIAAELEEGPAVPDISRARVRDHPESVGWVRALAAAAAVIVIGALGLKVIEQDRKLDRVEAVVEGEGIARAAAGAVFNPEAIPLSLTSRDGGIEVDAVLLPDGSGFLVRDSLRALPAGETYQLWALTDGDPISAGVLGRDPGVSAFSVAPATKGLAITRERAGGVVAPEKPSRGCWRASRGVTSVAAAGSNRVSARRKEA